MAGKNGKEVGRISIRVLPNTDEFRARLKRQLEEIEKTLRGKVHVDAVLDSKGLREKLKALTAGLDEKISIRPDIQLGAFEAQWAALRAQLAKDAKIKVEVDVDKNRLQRTASSIGDKIGNLFSKLGSGGGGGGGVPLGSFADTAVLVAAVAALLAPALALISGVLVSLPALFAGILVPVAAVALGLDGLKKAAAVLKPDLDALKATMSQRFQDVFTPILERAKPLFGALQTSLPAVADGLGSMAKAFVDTVTSQSGMDRIKSTVGNIAKALTEASPGVANFTDGLLTLADKVSAKFPGLSKMFNGWGDSFKGWVDKITTKDWFGSSPLDRGLKSFKETVQELLNLFGDLLKQGFDFLKDPNFGTSMKNFVADIKDLVTNVLPGLGAFFMDLAGAVTSISKLMDKITGTKEPSWWGDTKKAKAPNDKIIPGTDKFGFPGFLKDNPVSETVNSFKATVTLVEGLFTAMWLNVKAKALQAFTEITTSAGAFLAPIWNTVTGTAANAWNAVVGFVTGVFARIVAAAVTLPAQIGAAWAGIREIAANIWNGLVDIVAKVMANIIAKVVAGGGSIVGEIASWPGKFAGALGDLGGLFVQKGAQLVQGLIDGIRSKIGEVTGLIGSLTGGLAAKAGAVLQIHSPSRVFFDIGDNIGQGLADGISGQANNVVDTIKQILQAVKDVFGNASGLALNFNLGGSGLQSQMAGIATSAQSFGKSMSAAVPSVGKISDETRSQLDQIKLTQQQLDVQRQQLQIQMHQTSDKGQKSALQQQMDQLNLQKQQLDVQSQQLSMADKYGGSLEQQSQQYDEILKKITGVPMDFAKANGNQLMQDLGIGGQGALPTIGNQLLDWAANQFVFNVGSVDEAIAIKNNQQNKQALQFGSR